MTRLGIKAEQIQEGEPKVFAEIVVTAGTASDAVHLYVGLHNGVPYIAIVDSGITKRIDERKGTLRLEEVPIDMCGAVLLNLPPR